MTTSCVRCDNRGVLVKVTKHDGKGERVLTTCSCAPVHLQVGLLIRLANLRKNNTAQKA